MNDLVDHNLSEDKEDEPIDIPPADARTVLSAAATSAAATAVKDVIDAEVLDDNDSVVHWIGKTIKTVWEPEKIHKQHDADGNRVWTCGHCELVFKQWNHTKALSHCIGGPNIQRCKKMSPEWRSVYATIRSDKNYKMVSKELAEAGLAASIEERERVAMEFLGDATKRAQSPLQIYPRYSPNVGHCLTQMSDLSEQETPVTASTKRGGGGNVNIFGVSHNSSKKRKSYHQLSLVTSSSKNYPTAVTELDTAISHFLAANSLPFSLSEDPLFKRILTMARSVNQSYKPPSRSNIAGKYLTSIYSSYRKEATDKLIEGGPTFGITIFGDGATIRKIPLINMLGSNPEQTSCLLDIVDCSQHMSDGGKKDAWYIAKKFLPVMKEIDPNKELIDLVVFDGAANIQKAAQLLEEHYPRVTVQTCIEHTVALIFGRLYHAGPIHALCKFAKLVSDMVLLNFYIQYC